MRLDHFLFYAVFAVPILFIILVVIPNNESTEKNMLIRRETFSNGTAQIFDLIHQHLNNLESNIGLLQDELLATQIQSGALQWLNDVKSGIDKLYRDLDDLELQLKTQVKLTSTTLAYKTNPIEISRSIHLAIHHLQERLDSLREVHFASMLQRSGDIGKFNVTSILKSKAKEESKTGTLFCNGRRVDSEVVYWKSVPGDADYESPYRRKYVKNKKFLTFKYDPSGYNNLRMSFESLAVLAHAMGRVFVIPPDNNEESELDLNNDEKILRNKTRDLGMNDIFNMRVLRSHKGFSTLTMDEFIEREAKSGHIKNIKPPPIEGRLRGDALWDYLVSVADVSYGWDTKFFVFDDHDGELQISEETTPSGRLQDRLHAFFGQDEDGRAIVNYNKVC